MLIKLMIATMIARRRMMIEIRVVRSFVLIILLNFVIHTWGAVSVHGLRVHGLSRLISYGLRGLSVCGLRRWSVYDLRGLWSGGIECLWSECRLWYQHIESPWSERIGCPVVLGVSIVWASIFWVSIVWGNWVSMIWGGWVSMIWVVWVFIVWGDWVSMVWGARTYGNQAPYIDNRLNLCKC